MKNQFLLFFATALVIPNLCCQEYNIWGHVKDAKGDPMAYAHVVLLHNVDSMIIKGTSTDDNGLFEIKGVPMGEYYLKASYIENESGLVPIKVDSDKDIGTLVVKENAQNLDEVIVTSQKPRLERKVDRLVFYTENTALTDGSIWDILKRTPSVVITQNRLTIKGNSNIGILINDKLVNLPHDDVINLLSGSSASNVEAIEVITNPPAKYSAEGGMLVNIRMKKNLIAGYNGAVYNRYLQGVFPKHTLGTDHFFKGKKTSFSINYAWNEEKSIIRYTDITNFFENDMIGSTWTAEQDYTRTRKRHNISTFFDYGWNDKNSLSFSSVTSFLPSVHRLYDTETVITDVNKVPLSSFLTINDSDEEQLNSSYYLDFIHKVNGNGDEVSFGTHYTYYDYKRGQDLDTDFFDVDGRPIGTNDFITLSEQRIDLFSIQGDYMGTMGESHKLEAGIRYAGITSESNISQEGFDRNQPGINPTEAGKFTYEESIYAAYLGFDAKWNLWNLKSGLRAEFTETLGNLDIANKANENDYLELFPSLSVQYAPNKKNEFNLYYFRRINRPRYNSINPFQVFQSNFSTIEGNPNLLPAIRHYLASGYTFDRSYTLEVFYRNEENKSLPLVLQDNDDQLLRFIHSNLENNVRYGLDFSISNDFTDFWNCYFLSSFYQAKYRFTDEDSGMPVINEQFSWFVMTNNSFHTLKDKSLTIDIRFNYFSAVVTGNSRQDNYSELDVFFRKSLWNKKASLTVGVSDIFKQSNLFNTRNYLDQNNTSLFRPENRQLTLGFRYKFGNLGIRSNKKSKRVKERRRI